jgi:hypothetical protein
VEDVPCKRVELEKNKFGKRKKKSIQWYRQVGA